ncbi:unnamed protein product [Diamesa hyperborea]
MNEKVVKIYLPDNIPKETLFLYGNLKFCEKFFTYFVIKWSSKLIDSGDNVINFLGLSSTSKTSKIPEYENCLEVQLNQSDITDVKITIQKQLINPSGIQLIYYNANKFLQVSKNLHPQESVNKNDFYYLAQLFRVENSKNPNQSFIQQIPQYVYKTTLLVTSVGSKILSPIEPLFEKTAIFRHFRTWRKCLDDENSHGAIVFDILIGLIVFALLTTVTQPAKYFMDIAELIVNKLRHLLQMLEGSPVGLKLNVQLNNFLLSCFMYHVDLWWNFIIIVEPAIHYLFFPLGVLGMFGISFQSAMLCDVITLITLHAHCFYIYAAMLYKIEISSIRSLMRIVLGRRKNILKNRVESQEYTNRQLYLATLFFTTFLFLLPTVITYYVVFASVRINSMKFSKIF